MLAAILSMAVLVVIVPVVGLHVPHAGATGPSADQASFDDQVLSQDPAGFWEMQETTAGTPTTVADSSGNGDNGQTLGSGIGASPGPFSGSVFEDFSSTGEYVTPTTLNFAGASGTFSVWVDLPTPGDTPDNEDFLLQGEYYQITFAPATSDAWYPIMKITTDFHEDWAGESFSTPDTPDVIPANQWQYITFSWNEVPASSPNCVPYLPNYQVNTAIYIDGIEQPTYTGCGEVYAWVGSSPELGQVGNATEGTGYFIGGMSFFSWWDSQLSGSQISADCQASLVCPQPQVLGDALSGPPGCACTSGASSDEPVNLANSDPSREVLSSPERD
jgi:hypothetical protein